MTLFALKNHQTNYFSANPSPEQLGVNFRPYEENFE
jgi:hypothetical protein